MSTRESLGGGTLVTYTPDEVREMFERDEIVLIDVRTPVEYAFEHIKGALLSPMASFDTRHLPTQTDKRIVFHCGSGIRSKRVSERCLAAGFGDVAHMAGGMMGWKRAGFPYLATDPATGGIVTKSDPRV
ncbi:MAG: rhodanese-like domain-containing protein [Hyphomicrobiaceae bacterium]|nr:rhodanese-like domain-containing protein [Hyphomicrobiaceae bacterium]